MSLFRPYDALRAPQWPFEIDWTHQLSRGLVAAWPIVDTADYAAGGLIRDIGRHGFHGTITTADMIAGQVTQFGRAIRAVTVSGPGTSQHVALPSAFDTLVAGGNAATAAVWCFDATYLTVNNGAPFMFEANSTNHAPYSDGNFYLSTLRSNRLSLGALTLTAAQRQAGWLLSVSTDATEWRIYQNGVSAAVGAGDSTPNCSGARLMQGDIAGSRAYQGRCQFYLIWNRALTAAEHFALWNPTTRWELYRPPTRVWALGKAPAGGSVTISAIDFSAAAATVDIDLTHTANPSMAVSFLANTPTLDASMAQETSLTASFGAQGATLDALLAEELIATAAFNAASASLDATMAEELAATAAFDAQAATLGASMTFGTEIAATASFVAPAASLNTDLTHVTNPSMVAAFDAPAATVDVDMTTLLAVAMSATLQVPQAQLDAIMVVTNPAGALWTDAGAADGTWTDAAANSDTWTDEAAASDTWTEV